MAKKIRIRLLIGVVLSCALAGLALANNAPQAAAPTATPTASARPGAGTGLEAQLASQLNSFATANQGRWATFDAVAAALKLTPDQLFDQLHSGKSLASIAQAQGVALSTVQKGVRSARLQVARNAIAQALKSGSITQGRAGWLLQGLTNGWLNPASVGRLGRPATTGPRKAAPSAPKTPTPAPMAFPSI